MKKTIITLLMLVFVAGTSTLQAQKNLIFKGNIGKYPVQFEIIKTDSLYGDFQGRYIYLNKDEYLSTAGTVYEQCLYAEEYYKGDTTGYFFLDMEGDSLIGKWVYNDKWHEVHLGYSSGNRDLLKIKTLKDYASHTDNSISGSYGTGGAWMNDYWFTEENPQMEIGYNGGYAIIEDLGGDSLRFQLQVICGPTYHFAIAEGTAVKEGKRYHYKSEEGCEIWIDFSEKSVHMEANGSIECGFGARAYLDHDFDKITNTPIFGEETSLWALKAFANRKN